METQDSRESPLLCMYCILYAEEWMEQAVAFGNYMKEKVEPKGQPPDDNRQRPQYHNRENMRAELEQAEDLDEIEEPLGALQLASSRATR